tara:strand:+ start:200 stop:697 length:498 start_codon:yes stop_codon:yes gene_type:complete
MPNNKEELAALKSKGDLSLGLALIGTALFVIFNTQYIQALGFGENFDPGPKAFPIGLSILLILGGAVELFFGWPYRKMEKGKGSDSTNQKKTVLLLLSFLIYVGLMPIVGFALSTLLIATWMMVLLGNHWIKSSLVSIFLVCLVLILFGKLFKVPLPNGLLGLPF